MRVVVFGGSGTVGAPLLRELAREHSVTAVSRSERADDGGVAWARADAGERDQVERALEGAEVVYYLVHSLGQDDFEERDRRNAENVAAAAAAAGVRQIVYLGGLGDDSPDLSEHLRSRRETGELLAAGPVPVTTLQAAVVIGRGSAGFETIVSLIDRLPAMIMPRWGSVPTQPIALRDVVRYLAGVCGREETFGKTYDVGGPEVVSYREMIERVGRIRGKQRPILQVPVLSPRLSSLWLALVTPVTAGVARPLVDGLRNETVMREDSIRRLVPFEPTPFDEAVRLALSGEPGGSSSASGRPSTTS